MITGPVQEEMAVRGDLNEMTGAEVNCSSNGVRAVDDVLTTW